MAYRLKVSGRALREAGEAYEWYENQVPGLGQEFLEALEDQFTRIGANPGSYQELRRGVRRTLVHRFPYGIFFAWRKETVSILGVVHTSRNPRRWPRRA